MARTRQPGLAFLAGALLGAIFFLIYFGARTLDPREIGWILNGSDIRIEYAGWQFFRAEPWSFPPGRITTLVQPAGTSIANMDSIPLLAIALKPLHAWLPADFQYFGAWHCLCAMLLGGFAALLLRGCGARWPLVIAGCALFLWNPLGVPSGDNPALYAAGWLTLAGLWLYFRPPARSRAHEMAAWLLLALLAAGTNAYLCVMLLAIAAAFFARRCWPDRLLSWRQSALGLASTIALVIVVWWLEGYFEVGRYGDFLAGDLGHWSMNLLSPVNPMGWSSLLGNIRLATGGQYEGFVYFGAGIIVFAEAGLLSLLLWPASRGELAAAAPVLIACALLTVLAISPKVTAGTAVLFELPGILYAPFAAFRASGRFVQPAFYLMLFLLLRRAIRHLSASRATTLVLIVLALELVDIGGRLGVARRLNSAPERYTWRRPLHWETWQSTLAEGERMVIARSAAWDADARAGLIWIAGRAGLGINAGEPGRVDMATVFRASEALERQIAFGPLDARALYVVHPRELAAFHSAHGERVACRLVESFPICIARPAD